MYFSSHLYLPFSRKRSAKNASRDGTIDAILCTRRMFASSRAVRQHSTSLVISRQVMTVHSPSSLYAIEKTATTTNASLPHARGPKLVRSEEFVRLGVAEGAKLDVRDPVRVVSSDVVDWLDDELWRKRHQVFCLANCSKNREDAYLLSPSSAHRSL